MEVFQAIKTRRSIRRYKPDAIPEEELNAVLGCPLGAFLGKYSMPAVHRGQE